MKETRAPDNTLKSAKMFLDDIKSQDNATAKVMREKFAKSKLKTQTGTNQKYASMYGKSGKSYLLSSGEQPTIEEICNTENGIDFYSLAKMVKNHYGLVEVTEKYLIPANLEADLMPTSKWIKTMSSEYQL